ncbi:MAG: transglycosylase SLT domain-containing protein [Desulfosalsimonas sp.]|uniref:lytic transglycosylase domain-containing protein n=1 Tax=Desulfosalsimonas sp. TaxID=3073848 RepID=UPI00397070C3
MGKPMPLILFCLFCGFAASAGASSDIPSLFHAARIDGGLTFCGEKAELDRNDTRQRMEKQMLLTLWNRPQVVLWIKRANRYFPVIEQKLKENEMPGDLKYMALVESALRPHAGSARGAVGFWQFTRSTGRKYGLQINSEKDERRNIVQSTDAAISYLKALYEIFGSWTLAAAAYNMGEHGLQAEIMVQENSDFYDLYLPLETQQYVFRILAAKRIMTRPEHYGFDFLPEDLYPPLAYEEISVRCSGLTPIVIVAEAADTRFKLIKDLNPQLRGHYLAAGQHLIHVPEGSAKGFDKRFQSLMETWDKDQEDRVYVVQQGDNLFAIAERFNVPLPALIIWNNLDYRGSIHPGDRLVIRSRQGDF